MLIKTKQSFFAKRRLRIGEEIHRVLAKVLLQSKFNENFQIEDTVTISRVEVSCDLKYAKVYILSSLDKDSKRVSRLMKMNVHLFRNELKEELTTRYIPFLFFSPDYSLAHANLIENLLKTEKVKSDFPQYLRSQKNLR